MDVERWFDGCSLPLWVVRDAAFAKENPSFATLMLTGEEGDVHLPLFTSEAKAVSYIADFPLPGFESAPIDNMVDLRIFLELFRKRNGTHVRLDDPNGRNPGLFCPRLDDFISRLPSGDADKS